jgi:Zn finger protein HypA/HybF involved in hydrogenase expression
MPPKRQPARRTTAAKGRKATARTSARKESVGRVKVPRTGPLHAQIGSRMVLFAVKRLENHDDTVLSRKNAAILRATHEGCPKCKGNGQIFTKGKDGSFTGSKPCPAKPTKQRVSKWAVYKASRFGPDKNTGLVGWACPCGKKEKPRYRDAKAATAGLRTHEKQKHGGQTVGGAWYAQTTPAGAEPPAQAEPMPSKVVTDSGMTDGQWIKQNKAMPVGKAIAAGKCWKCSGDGKIHAAFGNEQLLVVCPECKGTGAAVKATA